MEKSLFKLYLLTIDSCIVKKGSEDLKITHVKIRNYRNLRDIDIGLAETVAIIGENNSGKSNFLKAITLPFLTDDNTHISKKLSWIDINNETRKCYYKKIILNQNKIRNDEITVEQFAEFLPTVSVEVNIQASGAEEYYVKDMSYAIEDGEIQYGIKYEFAPKNCADIFRVVKEVVSQTEINDANLKEVKMNLLPVEYYNYSIKVSDGSNVSYDTLRMFKYEALEAERDDFSKNGRSLLGVFSNYYNNYRYANYIPGKNSSELRKLFISFLKKQNGKFNFDEPCALIQFDVFKRFYINELGKLARYYFELIEHKARDINTYTYEIDSYSNAARVFLSTQRRSLYEQMVIEQNSIKELLLYMYKNKRESGVFRLLNDMKSLEMDDALVNDYLADLCEGKVNNWLIDYVDELYEEMEDIKKRKERKELLALIGNRSVLFDFDDFEDDENESYHKNMFESDDIEGGENL